MWIYDVTLSLLLATTIQIVETMSPIERPKWWPTVEQDVRTHAAVNDLYFDVGLGLDAGRRHELAAIYDQAAELVEARGILTVDEAAAWIVYDDMPVMFRGTEPFDTAPAAEAGRVMADLLRGRFQDAPDGKEWLYGWPGGPTAI